MSSSPTTPVKRFRERKRREGIVRLELQVRREDVALMRRVAAALSDPGEAIRARRLLEAQFPVDGQPDLKALLAAAPLEGVDLQRDGDTGRDVVL